MSVHIEVMKHEASADTGIITYHCRVVETDESENVIATGPIVGLGIEPAALANLNGEYETWIMSMAPTLVRQYRALQHHAQEAPRLMGKRFLVE